MATKGKRAAQQDKKVKQESAPKAEPAEEVQPDKDTTEDFTPKPSLPFPVVAIGASAGGLDALKTLLKGLAPDLGVALVIVQHMDPNSKSFLNKVLEKSTQMPVAEVTTGVKVEPNRVYIIPPNSFMRLDKGRLQLEQRPFGVEKHSPIDRFFQSLAEDQSSNAIAVVLSGTGSDGTIGLKAVKAAGGITLAQDEESAQYSGMPHSAAASGAVDLVASPSGIAEELAKLATHPATGLIASAAKIRIPSGDGTTLRRIFRLLERSSGVEFSHYKTGTTGRRIRRRMVVRKCETLGQYLQYMESNPSEAEALFQDITIHVTAFFREKETFDALEKEIFPRMMADRDPNEAIRIWVPGCSSGEEVYSMAISLWEYLGDRTSSHRIQIFGTDIGLREIEMARTGIYPESSVAEISQERLSRYFTKVNGSYQIIRSIREACVFARHDLAKDPPFSRLDLISCRNVLIYLGPLLQRRVMAAFHYALKANGILLLGKSESVTGYPTLFGSIGRSTKVYTRKAAGVQPILEAPIFAVDRPERPPRHQMETPAVFDLRTEGERVVLDRYAPPAFFVDSDHQIVHIQGDTSPYIKPSPGQPSFHLLKLVRSELVVELRKALHNAAKKGAAEQTGEIQVKSDSRVMVVQAEVVPVPVPQGDSCNFLVLFYNRSTGIRFSRAPKESAANKVGKQETELDGLRLELASTQEYLQSIVEDREASAEELRAANEEILSSNEELQSTNEELETAKEELQSSNEELTTLNEELENRNAELAALASDLSSLLVGMEIPIIILGADHRIRRFTPTAERVFNLIPGDIGRPIGNIKPNLDIANLEDMANQVIRQNRNLEFDVQDKYGHWYSLRMRPHMSVEQNTLGVLIALADIDAIKRSLEAATKQKQVAETQREQALRSLKASEAALRKSQGQLRTLAGRLLAGKEDHDRRITKELRENFNQRLAAIGFDISALGEKLSSASDKKKLRRVEEQLASLSDDAAQMAQRLHPSAVDLLGLASTIRDTCRHFSQREGLPVTFTQRNVPKEIPEKLGMCFFRVLQQSLENISRHAHASSASVALSATDGRLRMAIVDNGAGFDPAAVEQGLGLITAEERMREVGGTLTVHSRPGKGTEIRAKAPLGRAGQTGK